MNNKRVTMQNIADQLGITKVSVSKALNGQPGVSAQTRARVMETALEMGYRTKDNEMQGEAKRRFAMIVPKRFYLETDAFYVEIIYYLNKFCLRDGHQIYTIVLNTMEEEKLLLPEMLQNTIFDGVFLIGQLSDEYIKMLTLHSLNLIAVDFYKKELQTDCILTDNFYIGTSATQYLIDKGHKKIGFVGDIRQSSSVTDRYFGYVKALWLANLEIREDWHLSNNNMHSVYSVDIPLPEEMPTAFVCHCDMAGKFLIDTLKTAGYRVPEDVSIVTFDNTTLSLHTVPQLTTYEINRKSIAKSAYRVMQDRCKGHIENGRHIYVNGKLIERESVLDINQ